MEPIEDIEYMANKTLAISLLTTQTAFLGYNEISDDHLLVNNLVLMFKFYIFNARRNCCLNIEHLKAVIDKTKNITKEINKREPNKRSKYLKMSRPFIEHNT